MFLPHNQTLLANLATNGTLVLKKADGSRQDFDEYRLSPGAHVLFVDDNRYTAPTDFTLTSDGDGDITLKWLNATTLVTGKVLRIGVAYIDLIVAGMSTAAGGGGGGDASAANQVSEIALLTTQNTYLDGVEGAIAATNALLTTQASYLDQVEAKLDTLHNDIISTAPSAVYGVSQLVSITFTADTAILAANDIIADTQPIAGAVRANDALGLLESVTLFDPDDQGAAVSLVFLSANQSLGAENSNPNISDANAVNILGVVNIATTDYFDYGGGKVATVKGIGMMLKPAAGTDTVYVGLVNGAGTPTYAGGAPRLLVGVL